MLVHALTVRAIPTGHLVVEPLRRVELGAVERRQRVDQAVDAVGFVVDGADYRDEQALTSPRLRHPSLGRRGVGSLGYIRDITLCLLPQPAYKAINTDLGHLHPGSPPSQGGVAMPLGHGRGGYTVI